MGIDVMWFSLLTVLATFNVAVVRSSSEWRLVWSDDFDGPKVDTSLWRFEEGNGCAIQLCGWGNGELEWHTNRTENAFVIDGRLVIQARREEYNGEKYTSARMVSKSGWKFGRIEVKAKFPRGRGLLSNIWLLPAYNKYGIWPTSGELDLAVMINSADGSNMIFNSIYGTNFNDKDLRTASWTNKTNPFSDEFYVYTLEWTEDSLVWFVNERKVHSFSAREKRTEYTYPFNERFNLVLSLAVGGYVAGEPANTPFPRRLEIDYIHIYQKM